ncbi:hypothetical protein [Rhodophyticola porphyridii]|uniref:hypothetical protein n=1 Tax=Rhodophyticola porphyridii TaxID=1852017 RepID=UPI0035CF9903
MAQMGDANASIPTPQPVYSRPMFGAYRRRGRAIVGQLRQPGGAWRRASASALGLAKDTVAVEGIRAASARPT